MSSGGSYFDSKIESSVDLIDLKIHSNSADSAGGVEIRDGSTVNIVDTEIYGNTATDGEGGGIRGGRQRRQLIRSWVVANVATRQRRRRHLWLKTGSVDIENSIIAGNESGTNGGGFWVSGHRVKSQSSTPTSSATQASDEGAAIAHKNAARVS